MRKIYHFNAVTGFYAGEGIAQVDPVEKKPLLPAYATFRKPPALQDRQRAQFVDGKWTVVTEPLPEQKVRSAEEARAEKIAEIKAKAAQILRSSDFKVQRHQEQLALKEPTSLTDSEYRALLRNRQDVRAHSNGLEAAVKSLPDDVSIIDGYQVEY